MELSEIIIYCVQLFFASAIIIIVTAYTVYRIKKKKPDDLL